MRTVPRQTLGWNVAGHLHNIHDDPATDFGGGGRWKPKQHYSFDVQFTGRRFHRIANVLASGVKEMPNTESVCPRSVSLVCTHERGLHTTAYQRKRAGDDLEIRVQSSALLADYRESRGHSSADVDDSIDRLHRPSVVEAADAQLRT
jgi:hypothetical protein